MDTDRAEGVLLGLACGDALGRPVEFKSSETISDEYGTLTEMVGNGTWGQPAGTITDDTEQALCIARSLAEHAVCEPADVAARFVDWYDSGPFDIGNMTRKALFNLKEGQTWDEAGQNVWEHSLEGGNAGNGSVMRCPPLALAYRNDSKTLVRVSRDSSRITHADPRCTYGCAILNRTIAGLLRDDPTPLQTALDAVREEAPADLVAALDPLTQDASLDPLSTSGYVVDSLQTALHDGLTADGLEDAIVTAVNRGGDTDTIGAITGAIAGARYGASDLPEHWLTPLDNRQELTTLAVRLWELGES